LSIFTGRRSRVNNCEAMPKRIINPAGVFCGALTRTRHGHVDADKACKPFDQYLDSHLAYKSPNLKSCFHPKPVTIPKRAVNILALLSSLRYYM